MQKSGGNSKCGLRLRIFLGRTSVKQAASRRMHGRRLRPFLRCRPGVCSARVQNIVANVFARSPSQAAELPRDGRRYGRFGKIARPRSTARAHTVRRLAGPNIRFPDADGQSRVRSVRVSRGWRRNGLAALCCGKSEMMLALYQINARAEKQSSRFAALAAARTFPKTVAPGTHPAWELRNFALLQILAPIPTEGPG